jgi:hypothetical protein
MMDFDSQIRHGFAALDPLPVGTEGDWQDVLGRVESPRLGRGWTLAAAAVTAVAAVLIGVVALLPAGGGGPSNAAAALNRLANLVASQSLTPQPGKYLYIQAKSEWGAFSGDCETRSIEQRQTWIGADGSGLDRAVDGRGHFTSPTDRATCLRQAQKFGTQRQLQEDLAPKASSDWNAPNCLELGPTSDWSSLSSDPRVLLQQIMRDQPHPRPYDQLSTIESYLQDSDAPPAVRATLYQAAALIPDVQLLGTVRDHDGRSGLGIAVPFDSNSTYELIFDPQTGELQAEQQIGKYGGWSLYQPEQVVAGLPDKPPAPLGPPCQKGKDAISHPIPGGSITNGAPLRSGKP